MQGRLALSADLFVAIASTFSSLVSKLAQVDHTSAEAGLVPNHAVKMSSAPAHLAPLSFC